MPVGKVSDPRFDLEFYLKALFAVVKAPGDASVFSTKKNHFHTRHSLVRILDKCVFEAGLSPSDYSWHSFRRGGAVFAFELGLADSAVQLLGDWSSDAFKGYLEFAYDSRKKIAKKFAKSFDYQLTKF